MIADELKFLRPLYRALEPLGVEADRAEALLVLKATVLVRTDSLVSGKGKAAEGGSPAPDRYFRFARFATPLLTSFFLAMAAFLFEAPSTLLAVVFVPGFVMQFLATLTRLPVLALDPRDASLFGPRPVRPQTVAAAKSLLFTLEMGLQAVAIYALALIPLAVRGLWLVIPGFLAAVVVSGFVSVALAYLVYAGVLRFSDGEKLRDLLSKVQIALGVMTLVGYQVITRAAGFIDPHGVLAFQPWHLAVPPYLLVWLSTLAQGGAFLVPALMSLAVVGLLLGVHFAWTARAVESRLGLLLTEGERQRRWYEFQSRWSRALSRVLHRRFEIRAYADLAGRVLRNDRKLKETLYPSLASFLLLPALLVINLWRPGAGLSEAVPWMVLSLYVGVFSALTVAMTVVSSERAQGAWVQGVWPSPEGSLALRTVGAAVIGRFAVVPTLALGALLALTASPAVWLDLPVVGLAVWVGGLLTLGRLRAHRPFSLPLGTALPGSLKTFLRVGGWALAAGLIHLGVRTWAGLLGLAVWTLAVVVFGLVLSRRFDRT